MEYFSEIPEFSNNLPFFFFFLYRLLCSLKDSHKTQGICFFIKILKVFCMNLVNTLHKVLYNSSTLAKTGSRTMWCWNRINSRKTREKKSQRASMINSEHIWNWYWRSQAKVLFYGYTPSNSISIRSSMAQGLHTWKAAALSCIIS